MLLEIFFGLLLIYLLFTYCAKPDGYPPGISGGLHKIRWWSGSRHPDGITPIGGPIPLKIFIGYWGFPLIGYIPLSKKKSFTERLLEIREKNGNSPVVSWRIGTQLVVFLFDNNMIKEAFTVRDFIDRPKMRVLSFFGDETLGLGQSNGLPWQSTRRFTLQHLKDLGMGKSSLVPVLQSEAVELVKDLKAQAGKPAYLPHSITLSALNVIWQLVASKRYVAEDEVLKKYLGILREWQDIINKVSIVDFVPWLAAVIPSFIFKRLFNESLFDNLTSQLRSMIMKDIIEHEEMLDVNNPKDYIDAYLIKMKNDENNPNTIFTVENLIVTISDLFRAASETTRTAFKWIIFYLAKYPEIQKRLQKEIDEVLPNGILVTLADKPRLAHTEAFIYEVLRHSSFIKFGIMHMATHDTRLGGYIIPKGSFVTTASFWTNFDPEYWHSPEEFLPERFLDSNGKFVQPKNGFFSFGNGKRQCIGESLARVELLVFVTTILQSINFEVPPGKTLDMTPLSISFANVPNAKQDLLVTLREETE